MLLFPETIPCHCFTSLLVHYQAKTLTYKPIENVDHDRDPNIIESLYLQTT